MTVIVWIDPSLGGVYTDGDGTTEATAYRSIFRALSQRMAAFNAAAEDYEFRCKAGEDLNGNGDTGYSAYINNTSSSPRELRILVHDALAKHGGARDTGYRFKSQLNLRNANTNVTMRVKGIAVRNLLIDGASSTQSFIDDVVSFDGTAAINGGIKINGGIATVRNFASIGSLGHGVVVANSDSSPTVKLINFNVVGSAGYGINRVSGTVTAVNGYSGGNATDAYNGTMTRSYCMHDTATSFSGSTGNTAYSTANFASVTAGSEGLHETAGSVLRNVGQGPAANADVPTTDFEGNARAGATTDVGFSQYMVSSVNASGSVGAVSAISVSGSASSARSVSVTLLNNAQLPLVSVARRFWTRSTLDAAAVDGGVGGLSVTCDGNGVFSLTGLNVGAGPGWLTYKDPFDDLNCHTVPVTFT